MIEQFSGQVAGMVKGGLGVLEEERKGLRRQLYVPILDRKRVEEKLRV